MIQPPTIDARPSKIPRSVLRVSVPDSTGTCVNDLFSTCWSLYYCCRKENEIDTFSSAHVTVAWTLVCDLRLLVGLVVSENVAIA
jgi:hypothetical protein